METLLLLTYLSFCWIIFKVFKIPVNKWTMTTVVLGGIIMLGTLLGGMAYYHPATQICPVLFRHHPDCFKCAGEGSRRSGTAKYAPA